MSEANQEYIVISGARENNLKNVSLRIPKRNITIYFDRSADRRDGRGRVRQKHLD
ncbi:hypothetical protein [Brevibacillus parabrevis]|uniref:hypothetical protein n=1 Tax=Brevibacillus parabrevis TaxID=54914 RepID=UPI000B1769AB|nr:hypothetical protein [Brevibacillus parabrevis]